jgi:hypothetical protein
LEETYEFERRIVFLTEFARKKVTVLEGSLDFGSE